MSFEHDFYFQALLITKYDTDEEDQVKCLLRSSCSFLERQIFSCNFVLFSHIFNEDKIWNIFLEKRVGNIYIKTDGKLNTDDERASDVEHFME